MIAGSSLDRKGSVPFTDVFMWLSVLALAALTTILIRYFRDILSGKTICRIPWLDEVYRKMSLEIYQQKLPMLCWLTVILGPTYLVRYVVFLWVLVPVLLWEVLVAK